LAESGIELVPGQVVGELALLAPDQSRTQTLECAENGELLQITYEQVRQLYYQNPQFGFYFLQLIARRLFENIGRLESQLATCKAASVPPMSG
jgi:CRP/FNR family transcriptional regulator, cyclic AMP receptor protein